MRTTLADEWEFLLATVGLDERNVTLEDCKRCFFSGASVVFLKELELARLNMSPEEGIAAIKKLHEEAEAFLLNIIDE